MKLEYTQRALATLKTLPLPIREALYKQADFLVHNLRHPSLRAKKYNVAEDKWQARVNQDWRFYFRIVDDAYIITDITPHPK